MCNFRPPQMCNLQPPLTSRPNRSGRCEERGSIPGLSDVPGAELGPLLVVVSLSITEIFVVRGDLIFQLAASPGGCPAGC